MAVVPKPEPDRDSHTPEPEIVENLTDTVQVCITCYPIRFNTHVKPLAVFKKTCLGIMTRLQSNLTQGHNAATPV